MYTCQSLQNIKLHSGVKVPTNKTKTCKKKSFILEDLQTLHIPTNTKLEVWTQ